MDIYYISATDPSNVFKENQIKQLEMHRSLIDEELFNALAKRIAGIDEGILEEARQAVVPLERLAEAIDSEKQRFFSSKQKLNLFDLTNALNSLGGNLGFFPTALSLVKQPILKTTSAYERFSLVYNQLMRGKLSSPNDYSIEREGPNQDLYLVQQAQTAISSIDSLFKLSARQFLFVVEEFPDVLEEVTRLAANYNDYLRDRFVNGDDNEDSRDGQRMIFIDPDKQERRGRYVKIELIDGNPVLTDVLLDLASSLPSYREREIKTGQKSRKVREVSSFAISTAAEELIALADPQLLSYITDPKTFFETVGGALAEFYQGFERLRPAHLEILDFPAFKVVSTDPERMDKSVKDDGSNTRRLIRKLRGVDFDAIVQNSDDLQPDNKKEKDYFELRRSLLDRLYSAIKEISGRWDASYETRETIAKTAVTEALEIKADIGELMTSQAKRRLRRDKNLENEHYVGRQQGFGTFYFEREATPDVTIGEVIGASFDKAKHHLDQVIVTGEMAHIMRLSAPGRKFKSNILLIGPYGCGKTELARAVCADPRVIGASVSVASTLTAYLHESVNNVKRVYDAAKELRVESREAKPVALILDEFDGWFASGEGGRLTTTDMQQIETVLLQVLDGMEDYTGVITIAMTNKPEEIPKGIMRRFRYVDVVGQLTAEERADMLKMYLETSLPVHDDVSQHYIKWARLLDHAPGDVVRKVVDEIHFDLVAGYCMSNPDEAKRVQRVLEKRDMRYGKLDRKDVQWLKGKLAAYHVVSPDEVEASISGLLKQPQIQMQIRTARECYDNAKVLLDEIANPSGTGIGFGRSQKRSPMVYGR